MRIRYKGTSAHRRVISKADFENVGVKDQDDVTFATAIANDRLNPVRFPPADQEQDVSDSAGKYLTENDDFEVVSEAKAEEPVLDVAAPETTEAPEASPENAARGGRTRSS